MTTVVHDAAGSRFEAEIDGLRSVADYELRRGVMVMHHTYVPAALRGRGVAAALVAAALAHARAEGLQVRPLCSFVASYMRRHPETRDLIASG